MIAAWLPTLYAWGSIDAADVAMITLTVMVTLVASAMPTRRLAIAVVAVVVVLVGALTVTWAATDLLGAFARYRSAR